MNIYSKTRNIACGIIVVVGLFAGADSFAWHGGGYNHRGWGYHGVNHGNWGGYGYRGGYGGWRGVGYYGVRVGGGCGWIAAHRDRWGAWIPGHRACW